MPISTAYGEHTVEMQNSLFHEIGDSVQLTNDGVPLAGFHHDESELLFDTFYDNLDSIMDGSGGGGGNY
ncbi:hypothetical protein FCM35_KLT18879 [Carex littledalei]|uniref:Uncharacterized protein n=1 Tax=Carex littledalei TaxID=544730 RepID=A0A833RJ10_9POAL|nr:hypothetical protein FCM35_KLT18879 [Carex littledalei]